MRSPGRALSYLVGAALLVSAGTAGADENSGDSGRPVVYQLGAAQVGPSGALLRGFVNPKDRATTYRFEYGLTATYGSQTATASAGGSDEWVPVSATLTGLPAETTYHYRLVATNSKGTKRTTNRTFTTLAPGAPPAAPAAPEEPPEAFNAHEPDEPDEPDDRDDRDFAPNLGAPPVSPKLGETVAVSPDGGNVTFRRPGGTSFKPVTTTTKVPLGSQVDATDGSLTLTSALPSGETQTGAFGGGRFLVRQGRRGYVDLYLRGEFCPRGIASALSGSPLASAAATRSGRSLWGRDRGGRFRTHGKNSHATVRGTRWVVEDRCGGTLTRVTRGAVVVRDLVRKTRVILKAGERYLARPRS